MAAMLAFLSSYVQPRSTSESDDQVDGARSLQRPESLSRGHSSRGRHDGNKIVEYTSLNAPSIELTDNDCTEHTTHSPRCYTKAMKTYENGKARMAQELQQMADRNRELGTIIRRNRDEAHAQITELEAELRSRQFQFEAVIGKLEYAHRRNGELEESNRRQYDQLQVVKDELRRAEAQHAQTRHLLEGRTAELKGAQRFLNQTDSLSGAEVIAMGESLNAEILQTAAYMADSLEFSYTIPTKENITAFKESHKRANRILGDPIVRVLASRWDCYETDLDPTPVQIALQTLMVYWSVKMIKLWRYGGKGGENEILGDIFSRISDKEEQAVSGRWRSMARVHARESDDPDFAMNAVVKGLVDVLIVAGWAQHEDREQALMSVFRERLSMFVDLTLRLRKGIGEDITSAHIAPKRFRSGEKFDSRIMDDTYADRRNGEYVRGGLGSSSTGSGEKVAGTTEIGLARVVKGHQPEVLLKPKVVLCSAL